MVGSQTERHELTLRILCSSAGLKCPGFQKFFQARMASEAYWVGLSLQGPGGLLLCEDECDCRCAGARHINGLAAPAGLLENLAAFNPAAID